MSDDLLPALKRTLADVVLFARYSNQIRLRSYQEEVARAIVDSVLNCKGLTFVVIFPRQSGKNELQAQIEAYLLTLLSETQAEIVKISPTWKPQCLNAMRRLERVLKRSLLMNSDWKKEQGHIYRAGSARIYFFSGAQNSNIVGATASALLECDEAQDVTIQKWDKDVSPMAASTNATRVFWGTAWTARTLLARELRAAEQAQLRDGVRRVFQIVAGAVRQEVPAYGAYVDGEIARLGRNHPYVRTQYFSEQIDAEGGMFPLARRQLMTGSHPRLPGPAGSARVYALLVDVAGEDEGISDFTDGDAELENPGRDATALTVVEVDLATLVDPLVQAPAYRVVDRRKWLGVKHVQLYGQLQALFEHWGAAYLVIDATGVGAGLAAFLERALPAGKLLPFKFDAASKSELGWKFITLVESGRFKDYARSNAAGLPFNGPEQEAFWREVEHCQMEILPGPQRRMRWGVPEGTRDPATGALVHDDWVISAALAAELDGQGWGVAASAVVRGIDPVEGLGDTF